MPAALRQAACALPAEGSRSSGSATSRDVRLALEGAFETAVAARRRSHVIGATRTPGVVIALAVAACSRPSRSPFPRCGICAKRRHPPARDARRDRHARHRPPTSFALSPDGRQIVFVASGDGASRLWLRSLAATTAQPLAGTEGARFRSGRPTAAPSASSPRCAEAARSRRRRPANPGAGQQRCAAGRGTRTASSCLRRARRPP